MIEIELNNIKKNYGLKQILDGFCLSIKTGERVALIGQNGCGKSTILKIIMNTETIDSGTINIKKDSKIGLLEQIYEDKDKNCNVKDFLYSAYDNLLNLEKDMHQLEYKMTIEKNQNILESLLKKYGKIQQEYMQKGGYDIEQEISKICSKFSITENMLNRQYNSLSGGEKTKINLAKLLLDKPNILLLDEPTNHLDIESLGFLEELLLSYNGTIVIVSHDRYFLDNVATKTILVENGKEKIYNGNYSYFVKEDERRTLAEFENYKSQQKQIEKMKESIKTLRKFGELAKNEMFFKRAKSIEKRLEKLDVLNKIDLNPKKLNIKFQMNDRSGKNVLTVEHLYKKNDDKIIFNDLNLEIAYKEKIALIGKNGTGKTTFINMILGNDTDYEGIIELGSNVKIGYIPQNIIFKNQKQTILENFLQNSNLSETEARTKLAHYGFRQNNVFKKIEKLSGGEKVRILLMKLLQKNINFLILDEPTNHIDISTKEILEEALCDYEGTLLIVSHDRYFINKVADKIWNIESNTIKLYYGNFDYFMSMRNQKKFL